MDMAAQQAAIIAKIFSYKPDTWVTATISEIEKVPEEDQAEFVKSLLDGIAAYKAKVLNASSILQRGPNLNPEVNIRAWGMMHARFLARLFIKHPTLCERLCVKVENDTYNPGWRIEVKRFREIENHKERIEADVEEACVKSQLYLSSHSGYDFHITYNHSSTNGSHSEAVSIPQVEVQGHQSAAEYFVTRPKPPMRASSSGIDSLQVDGTDNRNLDESQRGSDSNPPSRMEPQMGLFKVDGGNDGSADTSSHDRTRSSHSKHVRFALAVEKNAAAELETISKMDVSSLYLSPQERAHQLHLERQRQAEAAFQDDDLYGVSDEELHRSASAKPNKGKGVVRPDNKSLNTVSTRRRSAVKPEVFDSDDETHLTPIDSDSDATISDNGEGDDGASLAGDHHRSSLSSQSRETALNRQLAKIQVTTDGEARAPELDSETEDDAKGEGSSPLESIDGDNEERFSLREMIDAMEYVAEHPWVCEHGMVDHVWDEYKLFHEYKTEALKIAQDEMEEMQRAAVNKAAASTRKGKEVDRVTTAIHRTRSTDQSLPTYSAPSRRATGSASQQKTVHDANASRSTSVDKGKRVSVTANSAYRNRELLQISAVYDALPNRAPASHSPTSSAYSPPRRRTVSASQERVVHSDDATDAPSADNSPIIPQASPTASETRKRMQIAAVYNSLGRQNEMPRRAFAYDGARDDKEEEEIVAELAISKLGRTRSLQPAGEYRSTRRQGPPSFTLKQEVTAPSTFGLRSSSHQDEVTHSGSFSSNYGEDSYMDLDTNLTPPRHRSATTSGQNQEDPLSNPTSASQAAEATEDTTSGPTTHSLDHQPTDYNSPSQSPHHITTYDGPQEEEPWFIGDEASTFGTPGMYLNTDWHPAPTWTPVNKPKQTQTYAGNANHHDFSPGNISNPPVQHIGRSFGRRNAFSAQGMGSDGFFDFGDVHQSFGASGSMNPFSFEDSFRGQFDNINQFVEGDMNQFFDQEDDDDAELFVVEETPCRTQVAGTRNQEQDSDMGEDNDDFQVDGNQSFDDDDDEESVKIQTPSKKPTIRVRVSGARNQEEDSYMIDDNDDARYEGNQSFDDEDEDVEIQTPTKKPTLRIRVSGTRNQEQDIVMVDDNDYLHSDSHQSATDEDEDQATNNQTSTIPPSRRSRQPASKARKASRKTTTTTTNKAKLSKRIDKKRYDKTIGGYRKGKGDEQPYEAQSTKRQALSTLERRQTRQTRQTALGAELAVRDPVSTSIRLPTEASSSDGQDVPAARKIVLRWKVGGRDVGNVEVGDGEIVKDKERELDFDFDAEDLDQDL
ncbi:hypothetical protein SBOR_9866 [Sclerotinia borealis F-4128]|uniref:Uncharacterized protein n=1 Tax=Sclerotinia borealis (strain F-4128) TaxID=1432307 RepID=W9BYR9_SCLBF|nr:hypothetical protein SBOR_9866 [Sclerotinia borealis F-4128]